jgi:esterase
VTLVGHSLGGVVAWWVAQRHPDLVAATFLEGPPLFLGTAQELAASGFLATFSRMRRGILELRAADMSAREIAAQIGVLPVQRHPLILLRDTVTDDVIDATGFAFRWLDVTVFDSVLDGAMMTRAGRWCPRPGALPGHPSPRGCP